MKKVELNHKGNAATGRCTAHTCKLEVSFSFKQAFECILDLIA